MVRGRGRGRKDEDPEPGDEELRQRTRDQIGLIVKAFGDDSVGVATPPRSDDWADFLYLYRRRNLLVRDEYLRRVLEELGDRAQVVDGVVTGLTRVVFTGRADVPRLLEQLDEEVGLGAATPDHVLYVTGNGGGSCCPATEPEEPGTTDPLPAYRKRSSDGRGVFVSVVDSGWHPPASKHGDTPWLDGVTGDVETIDPADLHEYAGHGTFIAGVIRCIAPQTDIRVEGFLTQGGAVFESEMTVQLCQALSLGPDIINLSAGTTTRANLPTLSFEIFYENFLSKVKGTVLVAAAGNDGRREPFWPAAFPWSVSVGAVDAKNNRTSYSNFGSWVDVYALGDRLVNAYPQGAYVCKEGSQKGQVRTFDGMARWSGTSFSTPVVVALIAARMSQTGLSARDATNQLLAEAKSHAIPGVGPLLSL